VSASTSNGDKRAQTSPVNGARSNGARTTEGLLANALAKTTHGIKCWTPVLPTEREEDWLELRDGINDDWRPIGRTEEELTFCLAMAFWQRRRLYRHEKELIIRNAKEEAEGFLSDHYSDEGNEPIALVHSAWNGGQTELRKEIAVCETVLALLPMLAHEPDTAPVHTTDALLLLERILMVFVKKDDPLPTISEPPGGWTVGAIREAVNELASDCGKKPATILASVRRKAHEAIESIRAELDQMLHHVEHAAVPAGYQNHDAARLWDYDRRHLNRSFGP